MSVVAVTGGSGFIGRHLISALSETAGTSVRGLARAGSPEGPAANRASWIRGDLEDATALRELMTPGGVLVHLAYPTGWTMARHVAAAERLADVAISVGLKRVVHCSTVSVVGRAAVLRVTESTPCEPVTEYEQSKLAIERALAARLARGPELVILRPTAVFGSGGQNLVKLAQALRSNQRFGNYLRSSLFGRRPMNLVSVANVVGALQFLVDYPGTLPNDLYIVSDDDDRLNNFHDVERELMRLFAVTPYPVPPLPIPGSVLAMALGIAGRHRFGGRRIFDNSRLRQAGYVRRVTLTAGLGAFANWFDQES